MLMVNLLQFWNDFCIFQYNARIWDEKHILRVD